MFARSCQGYFSWAIWIHSQTSHPLSLRSLLMLSFHIRLGLLSDIFLSAYPALINLLRKSVTWPLPPSAFILTIVTEDCTLWSSSLSPHSSSVQVFSSAPCSETTSICFPPLIMKSRCHVHTKVYWNKEERSLTPHDNVHSGISIHTVSSIWILVTWPRRWE
jgi:hypothetical protein